MVDIEKNLAEIAFKGANVLRGHLDLEVTQGILRELLFLKLISVGVSTDDYFISRVKGDIELKNTKQFVENLDILIKNNTFLEVLFTDIYSFKNSSDYKLLDDVLLVLNDINFDEKNMNLSRIFRVFLDLLYSSKHVNNTTSPNIRFIVSELLKGREVKDVYDPTIGYGSLSLEVASKHRDTNIYGQDINDEAVRVCKMQLILDKRIEDLDNIVQGNTIVNPGNVLEDRVEKFDCIVCNHPFALRDWGYDDIVNNDKYNRFHRGMPSKSLGDYAFITHIVESLKDEGIAIVVEPLGVLFREGAEGIIREKLIKENIIDTVISLPNNMMFGTAIPVNLIIFNKSKKDNDILFINVANKVTLNKSLPTLSDEVIDKVTKVYNERLDIEGFSRKVSMKEIEDNDSNLNIQRYIEEEVEREVLDMKEIGKEIQYLTEKLQGIQWKINQFFR